MVDATNSSSSTHVAGASAAECTGVECWCATCIGMSKGNIEERSLLEYLNRMIEAPREGDIPDTSKS
jgi:hypothetical protein